MRKDRVTFILLALVALLLEGCIHGHVSQLTQEDFAFLERGMTYQQVVDGLGKPQDRMAGSAAFITYIYDLKDGEKAYLSFYTQANYLDSVYVDISSSSAQDVTWLVPSSVDLPSGVRRDLTLNDFENIVAGMPYFPNVYRKVGSPNTTSYFEGGAFGMVYNLIDGARISIVIQGGYGCITMINYSPESFGSNWTILSEDTNGKCEKN